MARLDKRLEEVSIEATERDHGIGVGLFFDDPDGRMIRRSPTTAEMIRGGLRPDEQS